VSQPDAADAASDELDNYNYTTYREGLPQNTVKAIAQTVDGYLWFGTRFGLVRFDGVSFKVYDPSSEPALQHDNCSSLVEDRADRTLWVGQPSRITAYKNGRFTSSKITTAQVPRCCGSSVRPKMEAFGWRPIMDCFASKMASSAEFTPPKMD
jgi:ligand-binding sensor domain-containing protein